MLFFLAQCLFIRVVQRNRTCVGVGVGVGVCVCVSALIHAVMEAEKSYDLLSSR